MKYPSFLVSSYKKIISALRNYYLKPQRKKLCNKNPSIISSNCIGGIIYHDLNLQFNSPTINLFFKPKDYITFLENLDGFLKCKPVEVKQEKYNYPIGELVYNESKITINFMHYKSFDEALRKWEERKKRIDFNNLFIIWEAPNKNGPNKELLDRFLKLKYENKVLITGCNCPVIDNRILKLNLYNKKYQPGKIMEYRVLSYKRYLDIFNYVEFLNKGIVTLNKKFLQIQS